MLLLTHEVPSKCSWKVKVTMYHASRTVQSPFQPPPWWFQRAPSTQRKESQWFNLYHPKVQCHGNPGTPDSSPTSKGCWGGTEGKRFTSGAKFPSLRCPVWV